MTPRQFCDGGTSNGFKGAVHMAMLGGAVLCCTYNAAAFCFRGEKHNAVNAIVYGLLIALEIAHVNHHREHTVPHGC